MSYCVSYRWVGGWDVFLYDTHNECSDERQATQLRVLLPAC